MVGNSVHTQSKFEHLKAIVKDACWQYDVKEPRIVIVREKNDVFGEWIPGGTIELNADYHGANVFTLLHELAHHIHDAQEGADDQEAHGPEFAGILCDLLDTYKMLPRTAFMALAEEYGISVDPGA